MLGIMLKMKILADKNFRSKPFANAMSKKLIFEGQSFQYRGTEKMNNFHFHLSVLNVTTYFQKPL